MTGCVAGGCFGIRGRQLTSGIIHGGVSKLFLRCCLGFSPLFHSLSLLASLLYFPFIEPILASNRDTPSGPMLLAASKGD